MTPEGRRLLKILEKGEEAVNKDYNYAVKIANEPIWEEAVEKEIADIISSKRKLVYTEHQIQKSRK